MAALDQSAIDALVAKLQYYKYQVSFDSTILGPLNSPPSIEPDVETKETLLYETGSEAQAEIIIKNNAKITLEVNDVDAAMDLLKNFKKGDNLLDSSAAEALVLTPLTDDSGAKTLTFGNCYLQPGLTPNLAEGDEPNYVTLVFKAKPDSNGVLYTFAAAS